MHGKRGRNFYAFVNVNIQRYHQKIHWKRLYNKNKTDKIQKKKQGGSKKLTMQKHRRSYSPLVKGNEIKKEEDFVASFVDELLLPFTRRKLGSSSNSNRYKSHKDNAQGKTSANIWSTLIKTSCFAQ